MKSDIKDLYIALDLARFLADNSRLQSQLNDDERKLALVIANKIAEFVSQHKDQ